MKRLLIFILVFGCAGLAAGFFIFGKVLGSYVPLSQLVNLSSGAEGFVKSAVNSAIGIDAIRTKIILTGIIGSLTGLAAWFVTKK